MTGKERVHRAVEFDRPPVIPRSSRRPDTDDSDTFTAGVRPPAGFTPVKPGADEWGCVRQHNRGAGQAGYPIDHPLGDWSRYGDYVFPDPFAEGRFDHMDRMVEAGDPRLREKFVCALIGHGPIEKLSFLLGFENFLVTLVSHPARIEELVRQHHAYMLGIVEQLATYAAVDAIFFVDDSAMQSGPYFSMDMWCRFFKQPLHELCDAIHAGGKKVMMHSCGNLTDHIAEFIHCGVDILDNKQPLLWLDAAREFSGKIVFHSCLDYPVFERTPQGALTGRIHDLIRRLGMPEGGFIGTINNMIDDRVPREKIRTAWEAYRAFEWG